MKKRDWRKMLSHVYGRAFDAVNLLLLTAITAACVFPFLNIFAKAFSSDAAIVAGRVSVLPVDPQTDAMLAVLGNRPVLRSMGVTVLLTVLGTLVNMTVTVLTAYPLSKRELVGKGIVMRFILITMLFSGGMIPTFLVVKQLKLLNTLWALILPGALSTFNMIVMRTFFMGLPMELEDAALIDGCGQGRLLLKIYLPLSKAAMATLTLFYAVGHWNSYFNAMLYIDNPRLYTLQVKLRQLLLAGQAADLYEGMVPSAAKLSEESLKAATILFATVPILVVYPWLQKYFVKGVTVGAVKG